MIRKEFVALFLLLLVCGEHGIRAQRNVEVSHAELAVSSFASSFNDIHKAVDEHIDFTDGVPTLRLSIPAHALNPLGSTDILLTSGLRNDGLAARGPFASLRVAFAGVLAHAVHHAHVSGLAQLPTGDLLTSEGWSLFGKSEEAELAESVAEMDATAGARALSGDLGRDSDDGDDGDDDNELGAAGIAGAIGFGLVNGIFLGMADMFRDAARNPDCDGVGTAVGAARIAIGKAFKATAVCAVDTLKLKRSSSSSCDVESEAWSDMIDRVVEVCSKCATLRRTVLFTIVVMGVLLAAIPLISAAVGSIGGPIGTFIGALGGVVVKIGMIVLAAVFGAKFIVKTVRKFITAFSRCRSSRCVRSDKIAMIEAAVEFIGAWIGIICLSGLQQVVKIPKFRALFRGSRPKFEPKFLDEIEKIANAYRQVKDGAKLRPGSLPVGEKAAAVADDAARDIAKANNNNINTNNNNNNAAARVVDDTADDAAAATADDVAEKAAKNADEAAKQAEEAARHGKAISEADDAVSVAEKNLAEAKRALDAARSKSNSWKPGPPREYKRAVHVGNGKFETRTFGTVTERNPYLDDVNRALSKHKKASSNLKAAKEARGKLGSIPDDVNPGQSLDDLKRVAKEKAKKASSCGSMMLLQVDAGAPGACDIATMRGYQKEAAEAARAVRMKETHARLLKLKENTEWQMKMLKRRKASFDPAKANGKSFKEAESSLIESIRHNASEFKRLKAEYRMLKEGQMPPTQAGHGTPAGGRIGPKMHPEADEYARFKKFLDDSIAAKEKEIAHVRREIESTTTSRRYDLGDELKKLEGELRELKANPPTPPQEFRIRKPGYFRADDGVAELDLVDDYMREIDHQVRLYRLHREKVWKLPEGQYMDEVNKAATAKRRAQELFRKAKEQATETEMKLKSSANEFDVKELSARALDKQRALRSQETEMNRILAADKPRPLTADEHTLIKQWDEAAAKLKEAQDKARSRASATVNASDARAELPALEVRLRDISTKHSQDKGTLSYYEREMKKGSIFSYDTNKKFEALKKSVPMDAGRIQSLEEKIRKLKEIIALAE